MVRGPRAAGSYCCRVRNAVGEAVRARVRSGDAVGLLGSLAAALLLFTRFDAGDVLLRDEAIYTYAAQQLVHGVPPYASIFDPKAPIASLYAGLAVWLAHWTPVGDLHAVRLAYLLIALLTVAAMYLLGRRLFGSVVAAAVTAVVFAAFRGYAIDALTGPNAKFPGILAAVLTLLLLSRRQWFWSGVAAGVAALVWQPLVLYGLVTVVAAAWVGPRDGSAEPPWPSLRWGSRLRASGLALLGGALPAAAISLYFALVGRFGWFLDSAVIFPLTARTQGETFGSRLRVIVGYLQTDFRFSGHVFWIGLVLLVGVLALAARRAGRDTGRWRDEPLLYAVAPTFAGVVAFTLVNFQGYQDLTPLLPYAALGCGGAVAGVLSLGRLAPHRRAATAAAVAGVVLLTSGSAWLFAHDGPHRRLLRQEQRACAVDLLLGDRGTLLSLGDPTPLVLTHRRNPDRFIYLGSGVAEWRIAHTPGGLQGWHRDIQRYRPTVIVFGSWYSRRATSMATWLSAHFDAAYVGSWRVFLAPGVRARATRVGVQVRDHHGRDRHNPAPGRC